MPNNTLVFKIQQTDNGNKPTTPSNDNVGGNKVSPTEEIARGLQAKEWARIGRGGLDVMSTYVRGKWDVENNTVATAQYNVGMQFANAGIIFVATGFNPITAAGSLAVAGITEGINMNNERRKMNIMADYNRRQYTSNNNNSRGSITGGGGAF